MELAQEVNLPVIIHSRDAAQDTVEILKQFPANGVIHCYSYTKESAKEFLKMGYYFGIGGVLTFKNAKKLKEAVMEIPMDRILLETDSPYLAPEPNRGKKKFFPEYSLCGKGAGTAERNNRRRSNKYYNRKYKEIISSGIMKA